MKREGADSARGDGEDEKDSSRGAERRGISRLALPAALVLALVAACGFGLLWWRERSDQQLRTSAEDAATRMVTDLATYSHEDFEANIARVKSSATPEFSDNYTEVAESLRELVVNGKGESTAEIAHAAVESISDEEAVVLVFLDQHILNVAVPDGRQDVSRMVVTLQRHDGEWKLQDAQTV
ncbi:hypothetical protein [Dietzia timorensis]|uniref:Mce associated membrane protein n=1 Tax=Dietzia timorensis TaxID=499555 RepID=A0A173LJI7_9ACTN|nr:hypothetical protein [Dietzia timorensis]ANI91437.1 Uncharacterized protein BJL86_0635 [Dietzia timorensis]